jgi:hypothetical protein
MNRPLIFIAVLSCAGFSAANAEQYWIAYEGDDFPENEGWTREFWGDGAVRSIEHGALVTDSMYDWMVYDYQAMYRPINLEAGERFVMRWRLMVEEVSAFYDEGVAVFADDGWGAAFEFWPTRVVSNYEDVDVFGFSLGEYHSFEFTSSDMRSYELRMDGAATWSGEFQPVQVFSEVNWGDGGQGVGSVARWDYFEYGVVPEPEGALTLSFIGLAALSRCRR